MVHLYTAWLPPPVAAATAREKDSFAAAVRSVVELWNPEDEESVYATLKWISIFDTFLKAKSDVSLEDINTLVLLGLELFQKSQNKLYAQVRWGSILIRLIRKYGKKLSLKVHWRPLYGSLINTHFKRNAGPEGWRLRQQHFETSTCLVQSCRRFFPPGSASEIWKEFRSLLENPWHNSSFEGSGFVQLFLPMNKDNEDFFTKDWVRQCIALWESIPNCQFWDIQWVSVLSRCIKSYKSFDWECFLPVLFTKYLNMFEVPVGSGNGSFTFPLEVPRITRFLFSGRTGSSAKAISRSIVYLLKPGGSAQKHFERLTDLLEQFYHPSNGGRWTSSLERFLRHLVIAFQKRLQQEQLDSSESELTELHLGKSERASFVRVILKLIDRGQYSKNEGLAETVAIAMSILSYIEPSIMLPFIASRFHLALENDTATHQLKTVITSVAFASRPFLFASISPSSSGETCDVEVSINLLVASLSNALLGMDANDPPKTLATMQLITSIFSNLPEISDDSQLATLHNISFSEWLDNFFSYLFSLLQHLEPRSVLIEGPEMSTASGTFLVEDNPFFLCLVEVLLGKLSKPLYLQALKKISRFITSSVLPGAVAEVGLLCCACVHADPETAAHHIIEPSLTSLVSSLEDSPVSGYGGKGISSSTFLSKAALSPALETSIEYHLKIISVAITYAGETLLRYKDELKRAISSAFEAPSWKVNVAGDHLLRSVLACLVLYYPMDQYKCYTWHTSSTGLEEWLRSKNVDHENIEPLPTWHIPSKDELMFADELLGIHFSSALDDLQKICQTKLHSEAGNEKDHLKVTMLRILSSLQGVLSCLPDLCPPNLGYSSSNYFLISGATGASVGSSQLREKAAQDIHLACKYLLNERSDDSILLILVIRIIDALGNVGSLENEEWSNQMQAWKSESVAIIEPSCNFILSLHTKGKKRPRWALIDKVYMHNTWRSSQALYHKYRTDNKLSPPDVLIDLMDDLLILSLHRYETVRSVASAALLKILKRWPSLITQCILNLMSKLLDSSTPEHAVLGSCAILASQTVLRHLVMDSKAFSSFNVGLLASSHHESLKSQKAMTELFLKYNIHFSGLPRSFLRTSSSDSDNPEFKNLLSEISAMCVDSNNLHWRYHLMANRVLLLLILTLRNNSSLSPEDLSKMAGHFLRNLRSQLPQSRMLAISALNSLLTGSCHKYTCQKEDQCGNAFKDPPSSSMNQVLNSILQEKGFSSEILDSLSNVHIIADGEGMSSRGNHGTSLQSATDRAITYFYFDFSSSWPRTPNWISFLRGDSFYSSFARLFKRLIQECGSSVILALKDTIEEFAGAKERSKQCVACEAIAGILHSDISGLLEAWESWIMGLLQKMIAASTVEAIPDWAACIRYTVTGKGKFGTRTPLLRIKVLDCLLNPLPETVATSTVAKRYMFLLAAFIEVSPTTMSTEEFKYHNKLLKELLDNMSHSSAQVRETIGSTLSVLCSNLRVFASLKRMNVHWESGTLIETGGDEIWAQQLTGGASVLAANFQNLNHSENFQLLADITNENSFHDTKLQEGVRRMETLLHFVISSLKSGRSSYLLDIIIGLLYPVVSLQETSHKDLSTLAKAAFELLKWRIFPRPYLEKSLPVLSSIIHDSNWRSRFAALSYVRAFMYRHTFILTTSEKSEIWKSVETLLVDSQIEVREHAAGVLASLMKGGGEELTSIFRDTALAQALSIHNKRKQRISKSSHSQASIHGAVLALAASVLSSPYDMPSWLPDHVTLLARFISEPSPVKATVTKAVAEFRRTHADTWIIQKDSFTEEQLEVLADTSSSSSYFA